MEKENILNALGPCGLNCEKCFAFSNGQIRQKSIELQNILGHFDEYAKRFATLLDQPVFNQYPAFQEMLNHFSHMNCKGCRSETCKLFSACRVKECSRNKKVDFCFECPEYPCDNTGYDEHLQNRWQKINDRMKTAGIENYYLETRKFSRY